MENGAMQVQNNHNASNIFRSKSDSTLSRKNNGKLDCLMRDEITILNNFAATKPILDTKLQTCQLFNSESCLSYDDKIENDVHTYKNMTACTNEKEMLFNQSSKISLSSLQCSANRETIKTRQNDLPEDKHDNISFKEQIAESCASKMEQSCREITNSQLQTNDNETLIGKKRDEEDLSTKLRTNSTLNIQMRNNLTSRPTLADDSKLVKMSLLANPINIMQSNVQLLNKSRNFLNFITEKSTNIMEKALLPQHLVMKYNHVSRSVEADTARFYTNNESSSRDIISSSDTDLINPNNYLDVTSCAVRQRDDRDEIRSNSIVNSEVSPSAHLKDDKVCDDFKKCEEHLLHSNTVENEIKKNGDEKYILQKNDVDRLNYNIDINEQENKTRSDFLETEKSHNDTYKEASSDTLIESNILKPNSLEHPLYFALLENYTNLKLQNSKLLEKIEYLENSNQSNKLFQETQTNTDEFALQVENLEKTINKLTADLNTSLDTQEALKKECFAVNKEKENMVMKYVISEKQLIDTQRYI